MKQRSILIRCNSVEICLKVVPNMSREPVNRGDGDGEALGKYVLWEGWIQCFCGGVSAKLSDNESYSTQSGYLNSSEM